MYALWYNIMNRTASYYDAVWFDNLVCYICFLLSCCRIHRSRVMIFSWLMLVLHVFIADRQITTVLLALYYTVLLSSVVLSPNSKEYSFTFLFSPNSRGISMLFARPFSTRLTFFQHLFADGINLTKLSAVSFLPINDGEWLSDVFTSTLCILGRFHFFYQLAYSLALQRYLIAVQPYLHAILCKPLSSYTG